MDHSAPPLQTISVDHGGFGGAIARADPDERMTRNKPQVGREGVGGKHSFYMNQAGDPLEVDES